MTRRPHSITGPYLMAIVGIYLVTTCSWLVLWRVMSHRSEEKDSVLRSRVGQIWGGEHHQVAPILTLQKIPAPPAPQKNLPAETKKDTAAAAAGAGQPSRKNPATTRKKSAWKKRGDVGKRPAGKEPTAAATPPTVATTAASPAVPAICRIQRELRPIRTRADAKLSLAHRRKGLLWYSTYQVRFQGTYTFKNPTACDRKAVLWVPFPARKAVYDEFSVARDGAQLPLSIDNHDREPGARVTVAVKPGAAVTLNIRYTSRGLDRWSYSFGKNTSRARDFSLKVHTNFDQIDFPEGTLSPTHKAQGADGWDLQWRFNNLLASASVAVEMPRRINPGPLAAEISLFAPVSLGFFFFVLLLVSVIKQVRLHVIHFGMLAAAFFSFHLLMAYMVDLLPLWLSFAISSATSVALVVSYLRLAVGTRFAVLWAGGAQLLYLVLFSLAFFLEGYTGLTITIFSVLTLFTVMQLTGRIDWATRLGRPAPPPAEQRPPAATERPLASPAEEPACQQPVGYSRVQ